MESVRVPLLMNEDLQLLKESVIEIARTASELIRAGASGNVGAGSPAASNLSSQRNLSTGGPANLAYDAHMSMLLTSAGALDHIELFAYAAQRRYASVALGTTVRGALENLARANYLLTSSSFDELTTRLVASTRNDVFHPARVESKFQDAAGDLVDPHVYPNRLMEVSKQLGLPLIKFPNAEDLVRALLRPMLQEDGADDALREVYSQLSGVAHGNITALAMYRHHEVSGELVYPRDLAILHGAYLYTAICSVGDTALEYFGATLKQQERWNAARDRATGATAKLWQRPTGSANVRG